MLFARGKGANTSSDILKKSLLFLLIKILSKDILSINVRVTVLIWLIMGLVSMVMQGLPSQS